MKHTHTQKGNYKINGSGRLLSLLFSLRLQPVPWSPGRRVGPRAFVHGAATAAGAHRHVPLSAAKAKGVPSRAAAVGIAVLEGTAVPAAAQRRRCPHERSVAGVIPRLRSDIPTPSRWGLCASLVHPPRLNLGRHVPHLRELPHYGPLLGPPESVSRLQDFMGVHPEARVVVPDKAPGWPVLVPKLAWEPP